MIISFQLQTGFKITLKWQDQFNVSTGKPVTVLKCTKLLKMVF